MRLFICRIFPVFLVFYLFVTSLASATGYQPFTAYKDNSYTILLSGNTVKQGETLTVFFDSALTVKGLSIHAFGKRQNTYKLKHKFYPHLFRTFIGINALTKPGNYTLKFYIIPKSGKKRSFSVPFTVEPANFKSTTISIPKKKEKLLTSPSLSKESSIIGHEFRKVNNKAFISKDFIPPVKGRISSYFGTQRSYNNGVVAWYHKGLDFAAAVGTPIIASNSGIVTVASNFDVHGKTVIIDHGQGIKTVYNHMDKILVKKGRHVKKGEVIGHVGSTGVSTGPHLHFGLSVSNVRVNPSQWIDGTVMLDY